MIKKIFCVIMSVTMLSIMCCILPITASAAQKVRIDDEVEYVLKVGSVNKFGGLSVVVKYNPDYLTLKESPEVLIKGMALVNDQEAGVIRWNDTFTYGYDIDNDDIFKATFVVKKNGNIDNLGLSYECNEIFDLDVQKLPKSLLSARINVISEYPYEEDSESTPPKTTSSENKNNSSKNNSSKANSPTVSSESAPNNNGNGGDNNNPQPYTNSNITSSATNPKPYSNSQASSTANPRPYSNTSTGSSSSAVSPKTSQNPSAVSSKTSSANKSSAVLSDKASSNLVLSETDTLTDTSTDDVIFYDSETTESVSGLVEIVETPEIPDVDIDEEEYVVEEISSEPEASSNNTIIIIIVIVAVVIVVAVVTAIIIIKKRK